MFKETFWKLPFVLGALTLATVVLPSAHAQCGMPLKPIKPTAWHLDGPSASLKPAAFFQDGERRQLPSIVGMWHVTFTARTMNGNPIPNTVIDNAIVVWHEDKTEIMNSGRPPQDGNFCLGVWEQTEPLGYRLNHFAWAGNGFAPGTPDGIVGQPIGPVQYREDIFLGQGGKHYSGVFTLDQYDTAGKVAVSFTGFLKATRITLDTTAGDLL